MCIPLRAMVVALVLLALTLNFYGHGLAASAKRAAAVDSRLRLLQAQPQQLGAKRALVVASNLSSSPPLEVVLSVRPPELLRCDPSVSPASRCSAPGGNRGAAAAGVCEDTDARCGEWASRRPTSECESNPGFMHRACRHSCRMCGGSGGDGLRRFNTSSFAVGLEPRGTIGLLRPHAIGGDFSYTMPPLKGGKASGQHRLGDLTIRLARPSAPSATGSGQADGCKGASDSLVLPPNCRQDASRRASDADGRCGEGWTCASDADGRCGEGWTCASDADGRCGEGWTCASDADGRCGEGWTCASDADGRCGEGWTCASDADGRCGEGWTCASDSDGRCGGWAEVGECVENQGYMLRACRRKKSGQHSIAWLRRRGQRTCAGPLAAESAQSWRGRTRIGLRGRFSAADAECRALGGGDTLSGKGGGGGRRQALGVERELGEDSRGALLLLRLTNEGGAPIEVADLGVSMPFNQFFADKDLRGGAGPVLLLLPSTGSEFEARRPLRSEDSCEWKEAAAWVEPTSAVLTPGQSRTCGICGWSSPRGSPSDDEIERLEEFVDESLYQGSSARVRERTRCNSTDRRRFLQSSVDHAVRLAAAGADVSPLLAGPLPVGRDRCPWNECWSEQHSLERAYNYPHVTAVYWSLYRLGRRFRPARARRHGWRWYLQRAHGTAMGMWEHGGEVFPHEQQRVAGQAWSKVGNGQGTAQWGLMAAELQQVMERREIATWLLAYGHGAQAAQTADAVSAYTSLSPHWACCGSARRPSWALNSVVLFDHALVAREDVWLWRPAPCSQLHVFTAGGAASTVHQLTVT
ncbi:hypothetical protein EMIHUDRAFT_456179 [Emiliania huxleyi CCMP1516]|uniref:ShKT domain-containing protein n=2 Tax=Emiliania huxleyi TaxID=2903 RepID=A0A0D3K7Y0_EMIH1|nr:hypothetical protein EMIHUDRAFT_456179 [Emiliania huxleyi CCMP1516]EOD31865.1 hypothetical protein EMIHUDRAFT_456179 [Emiliania huxleyi CCMP1516]|eukprot:XP_005784294.1 hypothetical protein EMIHUDRAFT_456179 [Emiliania huxleyi CCMP1516]